MKPSAAVFAEGENVQGIGFRQSGNFLFCNLVQSLQAASADPAGSIAVGCAGIQERLPVPGFGGVSLQMAFDAFGKEKTLSQDFLRRCQKQGAQVRIQIFHVCFFTVFQRFMHHRRLTDIFAVIKRGADGQGAGMAGKLRALVVGCAGNDDRGNAGAFEFLQIGNSQAVVGLHLGSQKAVGFGKGHAGVHRDMEMVRIDGRVGDVLQVFQIAAFAAE